MCLCRQIEACFSDIEKACSEELLEEFCTCPFAELHRYHWSLGLWVRNAFLLPGQPLQQALVTCGIHESDDISALIVRLFYLYEKEKREKHDKR